MTVKRIAMWSGPRNISTAMMRSWENRSDCYVVDEPLYAYYLKQTDLKHPGRNDIIASQSTDWRKISQQLISTAPDTDHRIFYQKHMAHHLLPEVQLDWLSQLKNCFLIRDPDRVAASYSEKLPNLKPQDLGFEQQARLFDYIVKMTDSPPIVIDTAAFLKNPSKQLAELCNRLDIPFLESMLEWPAGTRGSDGVWSTHWYNSVEKSIGFAPYEEKTLRLSDHQKRVSDACRPFYEKLYAYHID